MHSRSRSRALSVSPREKLIVEKNGIKPKSKFAIEFDEKKIDAVFAEVNQCHLPGAAVGIAVEGKPVYRKGFGLANVELPVVLSPTIRMRIASITKHFTALAYMLLCEDGKARIDDVIGAYLPELHPAVLKVSMRQLMANISGLRDAHDISWQFSGRGRAVSSCDLLSLYRDIDDVNAAPGTTWIYCNGGFLLLSAAIERITGQSLEDVLRARVFAPVGMYDTLLRRWDTDFVPNSATLHTMAPAGGLGKSYLGNAIAGEGGMVSTVDDMLRWLAHMDAPVVGNAATWSIMKTPQRLANGTSTGYGLGLFTGRYRGIETLYHAGGVMGGNSQMLKVPAAGLDIVIMANRGDILAWSLANKILDTCLSGLDPIKKIFRGKFATGIFYSSSSGRVVQLFAKDGQQIASINGVDMPVEPDREGVLWPAGVFSVSKQAMTLIGDPERPAAIRFSHFGNIDELVLARQTEPTDVGGIAGRYRSDAAGIGITIAQNDVGLQLTTVGRFGSVIYQLQYLADGIWRVTSVDPTPRNGVVLFDSDGAAFRFSNDRIWALPFRRDA